MQSENKNEKIYLTFRGSIPWLIKNNGKKIEVFCRKFYTSQANAMV